jgi:hypothetical protein
MGTKREVPMKRRRTSPASGSVEASISTSRRRSSTCGGMPLRVSIRARGTSSVTAMMRKSCTNEGGIRCGLAQSRLLKTPASTSRLCTQVVMLSSVRANR